MSHDIERLRRPPPRKSSLAVSEPIALLNASRGLVSEVRTGGKFTGTVASRIRGSGSDSEGLSNETQGDEEEEDDEEGEDEEEEEEEEELEESGRGRRKGFVVRAAFLLTPSRELTLERATGLCERMRLRCPFSLSRTATGILFKFADLDDFKTVFRKGFHRVTGARRYWKVALPCRPLRAYAVMVHDVPEEVPIDDIRFALRPKFPSVIDVVRVRGVPNSSPPAARKKSALDKGGAGASPNQQGVTEKGKGAGGDHGGEGKRAGEGGEGADGGGAEIGEEEEEVGEGEGGGGGKGKGGEVGEVGGVEEGGRGAARGAAEEGRGAGKVAISTSTPSGQPNRVKTAAAAISAAAAAAASGGTAIAPPPPCLPHVRVTLTSQEEANILLQVGLDFYGATHFPTEAPPSGTKKKGAGGAGAGAGGRGGLGGGTVVKGGAMVCDWTPGALRRRVKELLPVFDSRFAAPTERKVKPRSQ